MAHLVRQLKTYYVDSNGNRVPKGTPGAKKVRDKLAKWYGQGIPGLSRKKRVPLATDKEAAKRMLEDMVRGAEHGTVRLPDQDATRRPLKEHLADFETDAGLGLASAKGKRRRTPDPRQVKLVVQRVRDVLDGCGFRSPADLNTDAPAKLAKHLQGRVVKPRSKGGVSAQTADFILAAARRFARWIARRRVGVAADLFDLIPGFDASNDRKHARRDVSPEELAKLLDVSKASTRTVRTLAGPDRHHLYLTAFATGFRASELATLTPAHFHLTDDPPAVSLPGKAAKNKKAVRLPLNPGVAIALRSYLADKPTDKPIWPGGWQRHAAKMLRVDLAAAGVPYCVEGPNGNEFADFHALRHTFVSALAATGVNPKELQTLARHGDPRLTLGLYTHARSAELARAVGRLRVPGTEAASPLAALDREQLEGITLALLVMLGGILNPPQTRIVDTPRDTPRVEKTGVRRGRAGKSGAVKVAG